MRRRRRKKSRFAIDHLWKSSVALLVYLSRHGDDCLEEPSGHRDMWQDRCIPGGAWLFLVDQAEAVLTCPLRRNPVCVCPRKS